jgi:hypothetical protein
VCVKLCEECGNLDWLRKDCDACSHRGVVLVCNRKYHGGTTHSKRHCVTVTATLVALGTKVVLHGDTYMLCPQPGCGLPALFDPASAIWGEDMCALCHFKHFCSLRDAGAGAGALSLSLRTHGHMACIRCGTMARPREHTRGKPPVPGRGYVYVLADGETRRLGQRIVCWRCWHRGVDSAMAALPCDVHMHARQLVGMLCAWNRAKFTKALKRAHAMGTGMRGHALRDTPPGVVDLDGHGARQPWDAVAAKRTLRQRVATSVQYQAEARDAVRARRSKDTQAVLRR